jgi:hypothetical protein
MVIRQKEADIRRDHFAAPLSGASFRQAVADLTNAVRQAGLPDWDGYGGAPVNSNSVDQTLRLLQYLPPDIPAGDVSVDPDGEVSIEWFREPRHVLSVSVSPTGKLSYAGTFGRSCVYGSEDFSEDYLPVAIRASLRRLFGAGTTA